MGFTFFLRNKLDGLLDEFEKYFLYFKRRFIYKPLCEGEQSAEEKLYVIISRKWSTYLYI